MVRVKYLSPYNILGAINSQKPIPIDYCKPLAMTRTGFGITKHLDNYAKMFIIKKKNLTKEVISCF